MVCMTCVSTLETKTKEIPQLLRLLCVKFWAVAARHPEVLHADSTPGEVTAAFGAGDAGVETASHQWIAQSFSVDGWAGDGGTGGGVLRILGLLMHCAFEIVADVTVAVDASDGHLAGRWLEDGGAIALTASFDRASVVHAPLDV